MDWSVNEIWLHSQFVSSETRFCDLSRTTYVRTTVLCFGEQSRQKRDEARSNGEIHRGETQTLGAQGGCASVWL